MIELPNYDNQNFNDIVALAKQKIPLLCPEWTDFNMHDPGITLIELFAWLKEMQQFHLNQITTLGREKLLELVGIKRIPTKCAQVGVTIAGVSQALLVPKGSLIDIDGYPFELGEQTYVGDMEVVAITIEKETSHFRIDHVLHEQQMTIPLFLPDESCKREYLLIELLQESASREEIAIFFAVEEGETKWCRGTNALDAPRTLVWEYCIAGEDVFRPMEILADETLALSFSGIIRFRIPKAVKGITLRVGCSYRGCEEEVRLKGIYTDYLVFHQQQTVEENICIGSSNGLPNQHFLLPHKGQVIVEELAVAVVENGEISSWSYVPDLYLCGPYDQCFSYDEDTQSIVFGDNLHGEVPMTGEDNILLTKLVRTNAEAGNTQGLKVTSNIEALQSAVWEVITSPAGGRSKEPIEEAITRLRDLQRQVNRAVTAADYAYITTQTPGAKILGVKALPNYQVNQRTGKGEKKEAVMTVVVVPDGKAIHPLADTIFLKKVKAHLEGYRLIATDVQVINPVYVGVEVLVEVEINGKVAEGTKQRIENTLADHFNAVKKLREVGGGAIGAVIRQSELFMKIGEIPGVIHIGKVNLSLATQDGSVDPYGNLHIPLHGIAYAKRITVSVRKIG